MKVQKNVLPLYGVLSDMGYSSLTFLVPQETLQSTVFRYRIIDHEQLLAPIESDKNWWICMRDGRRDI